MNYVKFIKTAFDNKAVRVALFTLPPAALMYYLSRNKKEASELSEKLEPDNSSTEVETKSSNMNTPESAESNAELLNVDNLPLNQSAEILNNNPLTGETEDFGECIAISSKGTRCKRKAVDSSHYCWQHKKLESNGKD